MKRLDEKFYSLRGNQQTRERTILIWPLTSISAMRTYTIKNQLMIDMENEIQSSEFQMKVAAATTESDKLALFNYIAEKYDGAEETVMDMARTGSGYTETFKAGGYNIFASTKAGLAAARDALGTSAALMQADGVLGGALAGGPAGALVGLIGSSILASRFSAGNSTMKQWINAGSTKGGARMTLTDEFPIASLNTLTQSPIKKL